MNTDQITKPDVAAPSSSSPNCNRTGHVARLPKILRDKINTMLDDGATYAQIIAELEKSTAPRLPHRISIDALSSWKHGGYQDYLRNQAWRERIDAKADRYLDVGINDGAKLAAGGLYAAAIQICEIMDELAAAQPGETDADKCARMTNALSRISRSILMLQQHREALEKAKAAELPQRDPNKPFGDESDHLAVVRVVDKVLGIDRYRKLMMEQDAAAGRPWPSQTQSSATSNVALANSADAAPVSNQSSETSQISDMGTGTSGLKSEIPSSSPAQPLEPPPTPEVSRAQPQPPTNIDGTPEISDTERAERRPWNWQQLSAEYIEKWRREHNLL